MTRIAFSTLACPQWTLAMVASAVRRFGFDGAELRSFGEGVAELACEPALTDPRKTRAIFNDAGADIASLATSLSFDAPVDKLFFGAPVPPGVPARFVDGLGDFEQPVRLAKPAISLAHGFGGCPGADSDAQPPVVRVFGFARRGSRKTAVRRIAQRLKLVADDALNTGVRIALENGGGFSSAAELMEIVDAVDNPLVGVSYAPFAAPVEEAQNPAGALDAIGDRLLLVRTKDMKDGVPCLPGDGELACEAIVAALRDRDWKGWLVYEWDAFWSNECDLPAIEEVLPEAARRLSAWLAPIPAAV